MPDRKSAFLDSNGGYELFSWLKNFCVLRSRTWQEMYRWANSLQLFFRVLISFDFESPFCYFGVRNIKKLFCLMGSYELSSFDINLFHRNAWNCSFPILFILEIVLITWLPAVSRESTTIKFCDSSVNGLLYFSNTSTKLWPCFWNRCWLLNVCTCDLWFH